MSDRNKPQVILVLQGGGALGAYHIGAYHALHEYGYEPDWLSGISIGAINAAVLAGNLPKDRLTQLEKLWEEISRADGWCASLPPALHQAYAMGAVTEAILFGQPHFFVPRIPGPYFAPAGTPAATSFYDTSPLRATLEQCVDFKKLNAGRPRISLGATNIRTGQLEFFDNTRQSIAVEHIIASGSLPPGFPATQVGDQWYWDGGVVSNTPLDAIYYDPPQQHALLFMVDLWRTEGRLPETIDEVALRQKEIQYASRTTHHIHETASRMNLRYSLAAASQQMAHASHAKPADPTMEHAMALPPVSRLDIVHVQYHPRSAMLSTSDAEFSRASIAERRQAGYADIKLALDQAPWAQKSRAFSYAGGAVVHRVQQGKIASHVPAG